jgi:hypothetical protein
MHCLADGAECYEKAGDYDRMDSQPIQHIHGEVRQHNGQRDFQGKADVLRVGESVRCQKPPWFLGDGLRGWVRFSDRLQRKGNSMAERLSGAG